MINFNIPPFVGKEQDYIKEVIENNQKLCGDGPFTKKCNAWFEEMFITPKALLTTSCTHALEMAAILTDIQPGDEVIAPSFTFVSTVNAFVLRGATIVFVDIRPDTMNIDENLIEEAITDKTKAIVPVHYAGVACEMDTILFENTKEKYQQYKLINGDFLIYNASNAYDGIVMNPPYIRQEKIDELEAYGITKERLRSNSIFSGLPSTANMYMYFIMKAIDLLKNDGQLIVIFPSSWMKAKSGIEFQKTMLSKCGIENQIHIHGDVFEREALVDVVILKLVKGKMDIDTVEEYLESKDGELQSVSIRDNKAFEEFAYPFSKLATIKRGLTTGCNEMYINPDLLCEDGGCFKPIISSPKSIDGYTTLNARLDRLFCPVEDAVSDEISSYLDFWKNKIMKLL